MKKLNKKKRYINAIIFMILPMLFTGCFNYNDINKVTFATSVIFDIDDLGQTILYLDCIKPYRSTNEGSDKGRRMVYKGKGKTALEALEGVGRVASNKLNYSQIRAYIFTEKAAKKSIEKYLDLINNYNEFQVKPSAFIYYGNVEELLAATTNDEEYLGMLLNDLIGTQSYGVEATESNINYYLSNVLMGDNTILLPAITLKSGALDKKIEINGSAIIKDNVLVDKLDSEDSLMYNLMMGKVKSGILTLGNPNTKEDFISLNILQTTATNDVSYENDALVINKNIDIEVSVAEIQGDAIVDYQLLDYIKNNEEAYVNKYVEYVFNKYKEKDIDIFDVGRIMEIHYPKINSEDILSRTNVNINSNIKIEGTGAVRNSL